MAPSLDELREKYKTVHVVTKVVKGNRYEYAVVWEPALQRQRWIYLGAPGATRKLVLTAEDILHLQKTIRARERSRNWAEVETLTKILEFYGGAE